MNAIYQLSSEDFGRPLDAALFAKWKESMADQSKAGRTTLILFFVGLGLLLLLGGMIGLIAFFVLALIGIFSASPKRKAATALQKELGITNEELKKVLDEKRRQTKQ